MGFDSCYRGKFLTTNEILECIDHSVSNKTDAEKKVYQHNEFIMKQNNGVIDSQMNLCCDNGSNNFNNGINNTKIQFEACLRKF